MIRGGKRFPRNAICIASASRRRQIARKYFSPSARSSGGGFSAAGHYRRELLEMISDALASRERDTELSASFGLSQPVNNDLSSRLITALCCGAISYTALPISVIALFVSILAGTSTGGNIRARIDIRLLKIP